jgi:hypothetical protein
MLASADVDRTSWKKPPKHTRRNRCRGAGHCTGHERVCCARPICRTGRRAFRQAGHRRRQRRRPAQRPFVAMGDDKWALAVEQNLMSTIRMFRAGIPHLEKSDQGRLVAITSISAKQPLVNLVLSNATRAGVHSDDQDVEPGDRIDRHNGQRRLPRHHAHGSHHSTCRTGCRTRRASLEEAYANWA